MAESEAIDRISVLPDDILSHMISFLPIKRAVVTSILSPRWRYLWTNISNLEFEIRDDVEFRGSDQIETVKFGSVVNRVLQQLENLASIKNIRVDYEKGSEVTKSWIFDVVKQMILNPALGGHVLLPLSHITYCNLLVLKLSGDVHFYVPGKASICFPCLQTLDLQDIYSEISSGCSVNFPMLKSMHLINIKLAGDDSVNKLMSACPILECLVFMRVECDNLSRLNICIPSLKRLTLVLRSRPPCEVEINTPALEYVNLIDSFLCKYLHMENFSSLRQADISLHYSDLVTDATSFLKLIGCFSNLKFLSGSYSFLKVMKIAPTNGSIHFYNLVRLELKYHYCTETDRIIDLLERIENLEQLVIQGWYCYCSKKSELIEPQSVPKCLLSRLNTVSFDFNRAQRAECRASIELIRYFLKNGEVLQLLTISNLPSAMLQQKISKFPRASKTCQIAFK